MNMRKLKKVLNKHGITDASYRICERGIEDNKVNLDYKDGKWIVYCAERGNICYKKVFDSESEACKEVLYQFSDRLK